MVLLIVVYKMNGNAAAMQCTYKNKVTNAYQGHYPQYPPGHIRSY